MPVVQVGNQAIRYRHSPAEAPTAPCLLLLHMAGSSSVTWSPVIGRLAGVAEVVAPDLPGHGQSEGEPLTSIEEMAAFALDFLDALALPAVHLGGHSMGGAVALAVALARPARVKSLLLVSTSARLGVSPAMFDLIDNHFEQIGELFAAMAGGTPQPVAAAGAPIFPQTSQAGARRDFEACAAYDASAQLAEIDRPAAVLVGRDDVLTPPRWSERLAAGLPRARLQVVEGCGHLLPREQPRLVAAAAAELISSGR